MKTLTHIVDDKQVAIKDVTTIIIIFFSIWVFFHEYSLFTGQQGKWEGNSSLPLPPAL